jgi:hypothetical protein
MVPVPPDDVNEPKDAPLELDTNLMVTGESEDADSEYVNAELGKTMPMFDPV